MDGEHDFNEVYFNDAIAYDSEVIGQVDDGWRVTIALLMHERTGIGAQVFSLEQQFDGLVGLAQTVKEDDVPIIQKADVRKRMLDLYIKSRGSLLNYYRNLTKQLKVSIAIVEGSMDKLFVSEVTKELFAEAHFSTGTSRLIVER